MTNPSTFGKTPEGLARLMAIGLQAPSPSPTVALSEFLERPGSQIGRYRLLSVLGEGGMGIVYLAQQERPIKRQVALKIIKPGMDSAQVIRRFEAERQALALLDHPNVAHVYDAGATEAGRPYFAMEFVKGVPITEHCDRQKLTIEERLKLFVRVCEAIQHAHQKGIIHRDIKPSNILVALQGEEAIPKVIDFGVARAVSQPLTERTLYTEQGQLIGTPEYISPEQAEMTNQDIDTRADIYSLGVLLYEMLTGTLPFESQTLRRGSLEQMRAVLREEEPKTPSTRVSSLDAETCTKVARSCQTDLATLRRTLRGDLDWITLKAMEKDRMRRYQTAHALAEDIERHLQQKPVLAGPPGTLYRFQKLVRRNKGVFAAVAMVAAVLVLGAFVSSWQAVRATQAKRAESHQREQAQASEMTARQLAYASDMSLAQQALAMNDLGRARRLLEAHRPAPGEFDRRGWEWRYLWQECRSDARAELCRYPNSIYSVAYSPDGTVLAVAGFINEFVEIWDVPGRQRITTLDPKEGHLAVFSPQGDLLATDAGNQIQLRRIGTWDLAGQLPLAGSVQVLKFSPDGKRLAALSRPGEATVWEVGQWTAPLRRIAGIRLLGAHGGTLDFSPDGQSLVLGDADHRLQVVDLAGGNTTFDIPEAHPEPITYVAWSPNGSVIASGSGYAGGAIRLWEAASGRSLGVLEGHTAWICELIFSADGLRLYSASADQTIRVWDVEPRRCLDTLRGSTDEVYGLALSPDGTTLASASKDGVVAFWNTRPHPQQEQPRVIAASPSAQPAFTPNGRVLAVPREGTVSLFDLSTSEEIEPLPALGDEVSTVAYSPDGTLLLAGGRSRKSIRVWSCDQRRVVWELEDSQALVWPLGFQSDGRCLRSVAFGASLKLTWWDTRTWQPVRTVEDLESMGYGAISPDGRLWAVGMRGGAMHWLSAATGELLAAQGEAHHQIVVGIAFSRDGARAASVAEDGTVALWDLPTCQLVAAFKGHMQGAHAVAFSADGSRLATGSNGREAVKLWDMSTCRELVALSGQGSLFEFVAFSPDGQWLAACNREGKLHLWRAPSWAQIEAVEKQEGSHGPAR